MSETRPELTFDRIVVGETYAEREIDVTQEMVAAYAAAVGARAAPACLMAASWSVPRVSFLGWQVPGGGIHARQTWQSFRAVLPGSRVRLRTTACEKFHSKSRPYVVFETVLDDPAGVLARGEMTVLWPR